MSFVTPSAERRSTPLSMFDKTVVSREEGAAVAEAEMRAKPGPPGQSVSRLLAPRTYRMPNGLWYDGTHAVEIDPRIEAAVAAIDKAAGYVTAGAVDVNSASILVMNSKGL